MFFSTIKTNKYSHGLPLGSAINNRLISAILLSTELAHFLEEEEEQEKGLPKNDLLHAYMHQLFPIIVQTLSTKFVAGRM